ncbi:MAG: hypothetical protein GY793_12045 [Proteobacteria bacterium]|nr:hypothetical protein [Pseudomonadota bacterium]
MIKSLIFVTLWISLISLTLVDKAEAYKTKKDEVYYGLKIPKGSIVKTPYSDDRRIIHLSEPIDYKGFTFVLGSPCQLIVRDPNKLNRSTGKKPEFIILGGCVSNIEHVKGLKFEHHNPMAFNDDGSIRGSVLAEDTKIKDITFFKGVKMTYWPKDNYIITLMKDQIVRGILLEKGSVLSFQKDDILYVQTPDSSCKKCKIEANGFVLVDVSIDIDGNVVDGILTESTKFKGKQYDSEDMIIFSKTGEIKRIKSIPKPAYGTW